MKYSAKTTAIAVLNCTLCFQQTLASTPGLEFQQTVVSEGRSATYLRINLAKFDLRVLSALVPPVDVGGPSQRSGNLERAATGLSLEDYRNLYHATAVLSGGYLASFAPPSPLGLVKSNGVIVSRPHHTWLTDAIFCSNVEKATIQQWTDDFDLAHFRDCLQAGPLLLSKGNPPDNVGSTQVAGYQKLANSIQEQAFLCTLNDNQMALGITDQMELATLVDFLRDRVGCMDAIRLTGRETAGLWFNRQLYGKDQYLFPSVIAVIPRRP